MHKSVHADLPLGLVDRTVDRLQVPHSRVGAVDRTIDREQGTVDRAVDRPESICSLDWHGRPLRFDLWFVLKGWKIQEKGETLGLVFYLHFYLILVVFPIVFL